MRLHSATALALVAGDRIELLVAFSASPEASSPPVQTEPAIDADEINSSQVIGNYHFLIKLHAWAPMVAAYQK